jgi:hypothetical protein
MVLGRLAQWTTINFVLGKEINEAFKAVVDRPGGNVQHQALEDSSRARRPRWGLWAMSVASTKVRGRSIQPSTSAEVLHRSERALCAMN